MTRKSYATPGPWEHSGGAVYASEPRLEGWPTNRLALMDRENRQTSGAERDANAHIMGAALALLEASEGFVETAETLTALAGKVSVATYQELFDVIQEHAATFREAIRQARAHDRI